MKATMLIALAGVILLGAIIFVTAAPTGPITLTTGTSSRADITSTVKNISAQAGNVTELNITANTITNSWQGYFGSISGEIVLADSSNNQFYNWTMTVPTGEVYASPNSSITWADIKCFNFTGDTGDEVNLTTVEGWYNIGWSDADGIDATFNETTAGDITVGTQTLAAGACPATYVYDNNGFQTTNWENFLATDNTTIVFGTVINDSQTGFDSNSYDFQMLVAEDGHGVASSTLTTYYFWIELG